MITLGIDIGSTTSKCILLRDGKEIIGKSLLVGGMGTDSPKRAMDTVLKECEITPEDVARTIVTGYGRKNFEFGDGEVSELTVTDWADGSFFRNFEASLTSEDRMRKSSSCRRAAECPTSS